MGQDLSQTLIDSKTHKMRMFIIGLGWLAVFGGTFLILLITYWLVYPYEVLTFREGNGTVLTTEVKAGSYIEMFQSNCKNADLISTIDRQFIDGVVYQVPITHNNRPTGCSERIEQIYVPKALVPGEYFISTVISFEVNPLRTVRYTVRTNTFTVLAP